MATQDYKGSFQVKEFNKSVSEKQQAYEQLAQIVNQSKQAEEDMIEGDDEESDESE